MTTTLYIIRATDSATVTVKATVPLAGENDGHQWDGDVPAKDDAEVLIPGWRMWGVWHGEFGTDEQRTTTLAGLAALSPNVTVANEQR